MIISEEFHPSSSRCVHMQQTRARFFLFKTIPCHVYLVLYLAHCRCHNKVVVYYKHSSPMSQGQAHPLLAYVYTKQLLLNVTPTGVVLIRTLYNTKPCTLGTTLAEMCGWRNKDGRWQTSSNVVPSIPSTTTPSSSSSTESEREGPAFC